MTFVKTRVVLMPALGLRYAGGDIPQSCAQEHDELLQSVLEELSQPGLDAESLTVCYGLLQHLKQVQQYLFSKLPAQ